MSSGIPRLGRLTYRSWTLKRVNNLRRQVFTCKKTLGESGKLLCKRMNCTSVLQVTDHCYSQPSQRANLFTYCENVWNRLSWVLTDSVSCIDQWTARSTWYSLSKSLENEYEKYIHIWKCLLLLLQFQDAWKQLHHCNLTGLWLRLYWELEKSLRLYPSNKRKRNTLNRFSFSSRWSEFIDVNNATSQALNGGREAGPCNCAFFVERTSQ